MSGRNFKQRFLEVERRAKCCSGNTQPPYREHTFVELQDLKNNSSLIPNTMYLITDFQTIYDRPDFEDVGYGNIRLKSNLTTVSGPIQPLVVLAISDSEFAPEAWMSSTPGNRYLFDFDLQTTHFTNSLTKGTIYECIDENDNRTGYNHPVIEFIRYEDSNGDFVNLYDKDLTGNTQLFKTFGDNCTLNVLGDVYYNELNIDASTNLYYLSKGFPFGNVISNNSFSNKIGNNNIYIEITGGVISNQIDVFGNTIGGGFYNNTIGNDFYNNTIGGGFNNNTTKTSISSTNFTSATHVYQLYTCEIVEVYGSGKKLNYQDANGTLVVADITD